MADSLGFSVVEPCQAPEFESLCKMLPPAIRHSFQDQKEVLKAVIGLEIEAHDFTVSSPSESAMRGIDLEDCAPEAAPAPTPDTIEPDPPRVDTKLSSRTDWRRLAVAATVIRLATASIATHILTL
jgi:hypothetical protein